MTIAAVIAYLLLTCYLGYLGYRQTKTAADYLVAGRSAHPVIMALSYGATFISTSAIVGFGGAAANLGMGLLWLTVLNIFVGIFIAFVFLGGPTRRMGHHLDAHTFPELMGKRYKSRFIQMFSAALIFLFMPLYAMAVMIGAAEFMAPTFHVPFDAALYIFALIVAAYVIAGGLKSVMLTDALQGAIMLGGMIFLLLSTYGQLGGVADSHAALADMGDRVPAGLVAMGHQGWTSMPKFGWAEAGSRSYDLWWVIVSTITMGVGIGVLAQPQLIVRFMTVKSKQSLNRAVVAGGIFIFFLVGTVYIVGPLSNLYFAKNETISCTVLDENVLLVADPARGGRLGPLAADASPEQRARAVRFVTYRLPEEPAEAAPRYVLWTSNLNIKRSAGKPDLLSPGLISIDRTIGPGTTMRGNQDTIIPHYVASAMPKWFGVIFLLTLLSAAMSTMSSQFHTMGTALGRDIFEQVTRTRGNQSVLLTRVGIIIGIIIALVIGKVVRGNIIALATSIFFALCGATFLPAFLAGLFWRRVNKPAVIASMLTGASVSFFWLVFINEKVATGLGLCKALTGKATLVPAGWSATWNVMDQVLIAFPASAVVLVIVALLTRPMDEAHVKYCFGGPKPSRPAA